MWATKVPNFVIAWPHALLPYFHIQENNMCKLTVGLSIVDGWMKWIVSNSIKRMLSNNTTVYSIHKTASVVLRTCNMFKCT